MQPNFVYPESMIKKHDEIQRAEQRVKDKRMQDLGQFLSEQPDLVNLKNLQMTTGRSSFNQSPIDDLPQNQSFEEAQSVKQSPFKQTKINEHGSRSHESGLRQSPGRAVNFSFDPKPFQTATDDFNQVKTQKKEVMFEETESEMRRTQQQHGGKPQFEVGVGSHLSSRQQKL